MNYHMLFALLLITHFAKSQNSGKIVYQETIKFEFEMDEGLPAGIDLSSMLPESTSFTKELSFDREKSMYQTIDQEAMEDTEMESDDGSMKMVISFGDEIPEAYYTDLKNKTTIHQQGFMSKAFRVIGKQRKIKWKVTGEKIIYLGYECTKATSENEDGELIVAWFTSQIPAFVGPSSYNGLPGAILMISVDEGKTEIKASEVIIGALEHAIQEPTEGKTVNTEEFEKIVEEKMKEMKSMNGGGSFIIRN